MKTIHTILLILLASVACADEKPHIYVFHINGVNTSQEEAYANLNKLRSITNIPTNNVIIWDILYNESHGLMASDLWDVFRQKKQEQQNLTIDDFLTVYMKTHELSYEKDSAEFNALKDKIKAEYVKDLGFVGRNFDSIVGQYHEKVNAMKATMKEFINTFQDKNNINILLIPHSQGNLYANSLHNYLVQEGIPDNHIGIVSIANPADRVESSVFPDPDPIYYPFINQRDQYVTAENDFVINSLRIFSYLYPASNQPTKANVHLSTCKDYNLCHGLIESYLSDDIIANRIRTVTNWTLIALMDNMIQDMKTPFIIFKDGSDYDDEETNYNQTPVTLLSPDKKVLCHHGICDPEVFGQIFFQGYGDYKFTFPGKILPGEYTVVLDDTKDENFEYVRIGGNTIEKIGHYYALHCESDGTEMPKGCRVYKDSLTLDFWGKRQAMNYNYDRRFSKIDACQLLPSACIDNKLILGQFVVGTSPTPFPY